jgi:hypothetical protein
MPNAKECGRCGAESSELRVFRAGDNAQREKLCHACHTEAKENRGLSVAEIAAENERWNRIFDRFVDPAYYAPVGPSVGSSFIGFASQMEALYRA